MLLIQSSATPARSLGCAILAVAALLSTASAQQVLITEFLASNAANLADDDGQYSDWIELANVSAVPINLDGWYLTDSATNRTKWRIPAITLAPGEHRIVWASDKNRANPAAPLHTNFKLSADGEYLGLIRPDGLTVEHAYAPTFPPQQTDISFGLSTGAATATFIATSAPTRAFVPTSSALGAAWTARTYAVPANWLTGSTAVGYETDTGYQSLLGLDVRSSMYGRNSSCYIRIPFTLASVPTFDALTLRMKYDDGFIAYLNGIPIAAANAPASPTWNSAATQGHADNLAVQYEDFDATAAASALVVGSNVLAIHGLNASATNSDFLILPELRATTAGAYNPANTQFFSLPTPGTFNTAAGADRGPFISSHAFSPALPTDAQNLTVTARVAPNFGPVAAVTLTYRVNFGAEIQIPMTDNGTAGDGAPADGVYGAIIPAAASAPGNLLRWAITATDTAADSARLPRYANAAQSPQYFGTMIADPSVASALPILYWWVQDPAAAATESGTRSTVFFNGRLYDNIYTRLRGQSSAGWPKPHYKLDFNSGDYFGYAADQPPVEEWNLQSTYSDKSYLRQTLAWETYAAAGAAGCHSFMLRVQQNGTFHSVAAFVEQPDEDMLARNGLDSSGALYKMYNECIDANAGVEKKTREWEPNTDLADLVAGVQLPTGPALTTYLFDHVDLPATISYLAATALIHDNDHVQKNYYLYRDTEDTGEWTMLPWDKDLTFGRNYDPAAGGVLSDTIWADDDPMSHPFFGDQAHPKNDGPWNRFIDAMYREPSVRAMYVRRLRSLMDELLQPPSTPTTSLRFETRLNQLAALCLPDVTLDRARWGNPYGSDQPFGAAVGILKTQYLAPRRNHLYFTHTAITGIIPPAQSPAPLITFAAFDRLPASGNQDEEFIELANPGPAAVDISGWELLGDVTHTFHPGTVIPAGSSLFVSPNVAAFRARPVSPTGGEGRFVQGNYRGHLASPPAALELRTADGTLIAAVAGCPADFTLDGFVDDTDFVIFAQAYDQFTVPPANPDCDLNADDFVDDTDFVIFAQAYDLFACP